MNWVSQYKEKITTAEEAVSRVKSNDRIFISGNAATPIHLVEALASRTSELKNVEVNHVLLIGNDPFSKPMMGKSFRHNSLFVGPADRQAVNEGRGDYVPVFLYEIPSLFTKRIIPLDVALIQVSPPDEHGFMSFGVECLATRAAVETARFVIAQVNERMPRTLGDSFVHISQVHRVVEVSREIPELMRKPPSDVEYKIGKHIASIVEDGSTLQLGIGGIPDAVLQSLLDKRDLGVHTEMVSDGIIKLIEAGVITNAKKTLHPGKIVATFIFGSRHLYDYVNNNPYFEIHPCSYTNNPFVISKNDKMVAINSAIEVDITGQVCSDSIGTRIYSGFGGQVDFIRGASYSKGGKPIIALPSTTKNDTVSRIVPFLKSGAGVVTSRADVHYLATEYGIADLHGKNVRQRVQALVDIAHPKFREDLERYAYEQRYLSPSSFQVAASLKSEKASVEL
jgi:4-hydroxybutyrate CoA-transferase